MIEIIPNGKMHISAFEDCLSIPYKRREDAVLAIELQESSNEPMSVVFSRVRKKKSKEANSYCWVLCTKIAERLGAGHSRYDVYEEALRKYAPAEKMEDYIVSNDNLDGAMKQLIKAEHVYPEIIDRRAETSVIRVYTGTRDYNSKEMSILISGLIRDAEELHIQTLPEEEWQSLCESWIPAK